MYDSRKTCFESIGEHFMPDGYGDFLCEVIRSYVWLTSQSAKKHLEVDTSVPETIKEQLEALEEIVPIGERAMQMHYEANLFFTNPVNYTDRIVVDRYKETLVFGPEKNIEAKEYCKWIKQAVEDTHHKLNERYPNRDGKLFIRFFEEPCEFQYNNAYAFTSGFDARMSLKTDGITTPDLEVSLVNAGALMDGNRMFACAGIELKCFAAIGSMENVNTMIR